MTLSFLQNVGTLELLLLGAFLLGGVGAAIVIAWAVKRESAKQSGQPPARRRNP